MKYYIIAGEASGDLHAAHLMRELKNTDKNAEFRFFGGDEMKAVGGTCVRHYKEMAYMGFVPVLLHLPAIFRNMSQCKKDIQLWQPDVVILVDYPGFNLKIAKFVHKNLQIPVYYYISPKIWAWKEFRIKNIKRDVDEMFSILPFEKQFYEGKHNYPIHYVGNPTADEVDLFKKKYDEKTEQFCQRHQLDKRPVVALLAGSRQQEIKDNLPAMIQVAARLPEYQFVVAGAPSIDDAYYAKFLENNDIQLVHNETFALLSHAVAALVTSGTATLETALFDVPQVVCYETPLPKLIAFLRKRIVKVKYISLVNLIVDEELVTELVADTFGVDNMERELRKILPDGEGRTAMLEGYSRMRAAIGKPGAPANAARIITKLLKSETFGRS
ncbi:MAG: lipid-A-disaccharide synthase [Prevotella sp.]|nr:lipid-A-disaccharide synthase [Prevotella sp.]